MLQAWGSFQKLSTGSAHRTTSRSPESDHQISGLLYIDSQNLLEMWRKDQGQVEKARTSVFLPLVLCTSYTCFWIWTMKDFRMHFSQSTLDLSINSARVQPDKDFCRKFSVILTNDRGQGGQPALGQALVYYVYQNQKVTTNVTSSQQLPRLIAEAC